ncbi:hypothetical protein HAX54_019110 [Datura stramonium]|uniref:Uncharacterized protein n=1 Tax=Datura stramonium TaxID=4076 RepID=A0ABS8UNJ1_DATST|nr:hypothetical protein [Datura stramonium]
MKLFDRFRKIVMRFVFPVPTSGRRRPNRAGAAVSASGPGSGQRRRSCDRPDPPKTSCSSYYSSTSHYNEAIADCIEFFNKSSQIKEFLVLVLVFVLNFMSSNLML